MSEIKHVKLRYEMPIGTRFTIDTFPRKTFEVVEVDSKSLLPCSSLCDGCFFYDVRLLDGGSFRQCYEVLRCSATYRKDAKHVIFKEVKE